MARDSLYLRSNFLRHQTQHRMVHSLATDIQNAVQGYHATSGLHSPPSFHQASMHLAIMIATVLPGNYVPLRFYS